MNEFFTNLLKSPKYIAMIVAAALVIVGGFVLFLVNNGVTNNGNKQEAGLNTQYLDNQNYLSDCITKIRETANVTTAEAEKFEEVMVEVIKGRYEGETSAQPGSGALFSAIVEQYPDLSDLNKAFERVYTVIVGCRSDYRGKQSQLLDKLRTYDSWRTGSWTVRTFGGEFPSDNLEARVGTSVNRGQDARDQMYTIVLIKDSVDAYNTGVLVPEDPFATK